MQGKSRELIDRGKNIVKVIRKKDGKREENYNKTAYIYIYMRRQDIINFKNEKIKKKVWDVTV